MNSAVLGVWFGGFIIPMIVAYVFLRLAGSANRKPGTATTLRVLGVLGALFLGCAGYVGDGGQVNLGSLLGVVVAIAWALKQQFARKTA
ncbi:hypothetical protein J2X06_001744 [Lysobacter niastensis]|uniref:Holin n=1 Tax=Lysobacter niastensis TaxID=380629 RepID=A0ABU1WB52_9GAMM|nr:hypothetical protein [Lysobacter niastensis]MDR7134560.1 hypothetical protein [Lysobacter niastensis]